MPQIRQDKHCKVSLMTIRYFNRHTIIVIYRFLLYHTNILTYKQILNKDTLYSNMSIPDRYPYVIFVDKHSFTCEYTALLRRDNVVKGTNS